MTETSSRIEFLKREHPQGDNKRRKVINERPKYPWYLKLIRFGFSTLGSAFPKVAAKQAIKLFSTPRRRAKHKVSDQIMEEARVFEFMFKGKILKGYEWGSGTKNVLLVHGWESRGTALRSFVPTLVEKGYKVVTFDAPAHGNSGGKQTNLLEFAGAIKAIINQIGGVESVIAHSFGGASTVYALSQLQQTRTLKRLVLIASPSKMMVAMEDFLKLIRAPKAMELEFYKIVRSLLAVPIEDVDIAKLYNEVDIEKTMLIHDKEDQIVPFSSSERIAESWEDVRFVVTEGYGHFEMVKDPKVVNMVGAFITEAEF